MNCVTLLYSCRHMQYSSTDPPTRWQFHLSRARASVQYTSNMHASAYTRVYESVCPVGVRVPGGVWRHVQRGDNSPITCPRVPPPRETVVGKTHAAARPAGDRRRRLASCVRLTKLAMPTHADSTHPTIQPLRYTTPPGTLWRIVRGAQRLHTFANTARLII